MATTWVTWRPIWAPQSFAKAIASIPPSDATQLMRPLENHKTSCCSVSLRSVRDAP